MFEFGTIQLLPIRVLSESCFCPLRVFSESYSYSRLLSEPYPCPSLALSKFFPIRLLSKSCSCSIRVIPYPSFAPIRVLPNPSLALSGHARSESYLSESCTIRVLLSSESYHSCPCSSFPYSSLVRVFALIRAFVPVRVFAPICVVSESNPVRLFPSIQEVQDPSLCCSPSHLPYPRLASSVRVGLRCPSHVQIRVMLLSEFCPSLAPLGRV